MNVALNARTVQPPDRVTVSTCIGCASMSKPGTCELGCGAERRLDLVDATAHDALAALASTTVDRGQALRAVVRQLTEGAPAAGESEAAYRSLQSAARVALHAHPPQAVRTEEPPAVMTTWWCPRCGGIDAPQPCLGICLWRPVEWVPAARYETARARADAVRAQERRLRAVLRGAVTVTPRAGRWDEGLRLLKAQAEAALAP